MIWGSPNMGPQIIHFNRIFHYKPSILGILHMWMGQNGNFRLSSGFIYHGSSSWQNGSRSYFESQHDCTEILGAGCEMTHIHVLKMVQDGCGHNLWFGDCRCWNMLMILLVERGHTKSYESGISGSCMVQILEAELHCITHGSNEIANYDAFLLFITNYYSLLEYTHLICKAIDLFPLSLLKAYMVPICWQPFAVFGSRNNAVVVSNGVKCLSFWNPCHDIPFGYLTSPWNPWSIYRWFTVLKNGDFPWRTVE